MRNTTTLWLRYMVILVLALVKGPMCGLGCLEHERIALLQLKVNFIHQTDYFSPLYNWAETTANCCEWYGVVCNPTTGRVTALSLNRTLGYDFGHSYLFNASMFLPFEDLKNLFSPGNKLAGWVENEGFERLSRLTNLELLDLSDNEFNNSVLSSLGGLSSLKFLYLGGNHFTHSNGFERLSRLSNLELLDLGSNKLNNSVLSSLGGLSSLKYLYLRGNHFTHSNGFERLSRLSNLELLDLSNNELNNIVMSSLGGLSSLKFLYLSSNHFTHFNQLDGFISLKELDLSSNQIENFEPIPQELKGSLMLSNLEVLKLSYNHLNNSIFSSLERFSTLKFLDLSDNQLKGSIHLRGLRNLEELDISDNEVHSLTRSPGVENSSKLKILSINGASGFRLNASRLLQSIGAFSSLRILSMQYNDFVGTITTQVLNISNVEELILDYSSLDNNFVKSLAIMTSLRTLSLQNCSLNGSINIQGLSVLKNLQVLDLSYNKLEGKIPRWLENLTSIEVIDFSYNEFTENIALSPLTSLTSLKYFALSGNHFQVPLSIFRTLANHSKLEAILVDNNECIMDTQLSNWAPTFQLKIFVLANCMLVRDNIPSFLYYQYDLRSLDLSHNNFIGTFPSWLLRNNTRLEALYLINNSFTGPFILPSYPNPNISELDISANHIQGHIPTNMSSVFPNLGLLNMSRNLFHGNIIFCFNNMKRLDALDLSDNTLSGILPAQLAIGCPLLTLLSLERNNFIGEVPNSLSTMYLRALDVSHNHLSGKLPRWKGNIERAITYIIMSHNHFQGPIPREFCKLDELKFLDLSGNNLSDSIPSCFNPPNILHVHLDNNRLQGPLTHAFYNNSSLVTLDLRKNYLSGKIPNWIGGLSNLGVLLLKANHFEGEIPVQLCKLRKLRIMDLSQNSFSGQIPLCLSTSTSDDSLLSSMDFGQRLAETVLDALETLESSRKLETTWVDEMFLMKYGYKDTDVEEEVEFTTKRESYSYMGNILNFMSGIDLSCNQLTGEIPPRIENLGDIHALNLSYNSLTGSIPATFSNLSQLESLDLSHNNLNGSIPPQLIEMNDLAIFSVAYNNLSGRTPERKAQFGTFEESSYKGNPLLCGPPLPNNCSGTDTKSSTVPGGALEGEGQHGEDTNIIDMDVFYVSFVVSYVIILLSIVLILYINSHWRRAWFYLVEVGATTSYYFVVDHLPKLPNFRTRRC